MPIHASDLLRRVALVRHGNVEQRRRILVRILHPHAAVTEGALFLGEQILVGRIVLINQELVWEIETDAPERIGLARRLRNMDATVAGAFKSQSHAL